MKVKAKILCFIGGARRKPGDEFIIEGKLPKSCELVDEEVKAEVAEPYANLTDADIRERLHNANKKVAPQTGRKKLIALLTELEGK
jgi:hypothetical protein